ncbi:hypothetical protein C8R45DRAFT_1081792 [Mycena sanguinolenta]|nr:hypothetical protein C8R45DRAFT_1081792 [Mycena sanguinolenta]
MKTRPHRRGVRRLSDICVLPGQVILLFPWQVSSRWCPRQIAAIHIRVGSTARKQIQDTDVQALRIACNTSRAETPSFEPIDPRGHIVTLGGGQGAEVPPESKVRVSLDPKSHERLPLELDCGHACTLDVISASGCDKRGQIISSGGSARRTRKQEAASCGEEAATYESREVQAPRTVDTAQDCWGGHKRSPVNPPVRRGRDWPWAIPEHPGHARDAYILAQIGVNKTASCRRALDWDVQRAVAHGLHP